MSKTQETLTFETPASLIESLLDYVDQLNVVFIDVLTNAGRRGWTFNRYPSYELGDRDYMRDMLEVVNEFREEWPNGHSTVTYNGRQITVVLT